MSDAATIVVICDCKKKLKAPASAAGKKARCPACGRSHLLAAATGTSRVIPTVALPTAQIAKPLSDRLTPRGVVASSTAIGAPRSPEPAADDGLDSLYELARDAETAAVIPRGPQCPSCTAAIADGATLCVHCGYNLSTGQKLATSKPALGYASKTAAAAKSKPAELIAAGGSFLIGTVVSAIFAIIASSLWFALAYFTGFAIGYIAMLIGVAAGIGMKIGMRSESSVGGVVAAGLTLVAILIAKLAVLEAIAAHAGKVVILSHVPPAMLGFYFFSPLSSIIMLVGMSAAFRTARG